MRNLLCILLISAAALARAGEDLVETVGLLPVDYRHQAIQQLALAEKNQETLLKTIRASKPEWRVGLGFLLANMPERDLTSLTQELLLNNLEYAYKARNDTAWAKAIPEELFLNNVLPYVNINERRDDWRKDFYDRFMPLVKDCKTAEEAVLVLNKAVFATTEVKYHPTKRPKPDQSPYESMEAKFASCTGLSIMLTDACRAVGVPARLAGTPLWVNKSGNHTWVEVWDKQWHFVGACEQSKLNSTWFFGNASKADITKPEHRIYAVSFLRTKGYFPLVWDKEIRYVPSEDVSRSYAFRRTAVFKAVKSAGGEVVNATIAVRADGVLLAQALAGTPARFDLGGGQKLEVTAEVAGAGKTTQIVELSENSEPAEQVFEIILK